MELDELLQQVKGRLVVSCQAYPGEALRFPAAMTAMAQAALAGGAVGIRAQGIDDLVAIRAITDVPLIGLWKDGADGVFITPTVEHALAVVRTGADMVALDGTRRPRPDGRGLAETFAAIHDAGGLVLADVGSLDDALASVEAGADAVATSLAGYTGERPKTPGPDLDLIAEIVAHTDIPVFAEGRVRTPEEAAAALDAGAWTVVVGTAITHPTTLTRNFVAGLQHS